MYNFCSKWRSKELNHAATGDLKSSRRDLKGAGLDCRTYPYHFFRLVSPPPPKLYITCRVQSGQYQMKLTFICAKLLFESSMGIRAIL